MTEKKLLTIIWATIIIALSRIFDWISTSDQNSLGPIKLKVEDGLFDLTLIIVISFLLWLWYHKYNHKLKEELTNITEKYLLHHLTHKLLRRVNNKNFGPKSCHYNCVFNDFISEPNQFKIESSELHPDIEKLVKKGVVARVQLIKPDRFNDYVKVGHVCHAFSTADLRNTLPPYINWIIKEPLFAEACLPALISLCLIAALALQLLF